MNSSLGIECYKTTLTVAEKQLQIKISGGDSDGILYGIMNLIEQLQSTGTVKNIQESLRFPFRALKFNLPYSPYREGKVSTLLSSTEYGIHWMVRNEDFSVLRW